MKTSNPGPYAVRGRRAFLGASLALALGCVLITASASADEQWSSWNTFTSEQVSVSFSRVRSDTWTWKFRNDGPLTITYMKFQYTDKDGSHSDVLPVNLKPGAVHGGWSSFTASSNPTIRILEIKRK